MPCLRFHRGVVTYPGIGRSVDSGIAPTIRPPAVVVNRDLPFNHSEPPKEALTGSFRPNLTQKPGESWPDATHLGQTRYDCGPLTSRGGSARGTGSGSTLSQCRTPICWSAMGCPEVRRVLERAFRALPRAIRSDNGRPSPASAWEACLRWRYGGSSWVSYLSVSNPVTQSKTDAGHLDPAWRRPGGSREPLTPSGGNVGRQRWAGEQPRSAGGDFPPPLPQGEG